MYCSCTFWAANAQRPLTASSGMENSVIQVWSVIGVKVSVFQVGSRLAGDVENCRKTRLSRPCAVIFSPGNRGSLSGGQVHLNISSQRPQRPKAFFCSRGVSSTAYAVVSKVAGEKGSTMPIPAPAHPTYKLLDIIKYALAEDKGDRGDITCLSTIPASTKAKAQFIAKDDGLVAGIELAAMIFREVDPDLEIQWDVKDGDEVRKGLRFGIVNGNARSILIAERVVLNFMQRMSGIATCTKRMAEAARPARILDTRKTAPGLRLVDKWAIYRVKAPYVVSVLVDLVTAYEIVQYLVLIGAGENHRMGLYDMMLVKDNHIDVAGGILNAITAVDNFMKGEKLNVGVEIETRTLKEVQEVLECISNGKECVTRIMLDNMVRRLPGGGVDVSMLQQAVDLVNGRVETEASGNVTLETVKEIAATGVTYISSGALTHSVLALDISLKIDTSLGS